MAKPHSITKLHMTRQFKVPAEKVFDAWLNPAMMSKWLFTTEATNQVATNDPRVGGDWQITDFRGGTEYTAIGTYIEIDRPRRLVFTFRMPQFSDMSDTITVEFRVLEQGCEMSFTQEITVPHEDNWTEADIAKAMEEYRSSTEHGWSLMFSGLLLLTLLQARVEHTGASALDPAAIDAIYAEHIRDADDQVLAGLRFLQYIKPDELAATERGQQLLRSFIRPSDPPQ